MRMRLVDQRQTNEFTVHTVRVEGQGVWTVFGHQDPALDFVVDPGGVIYADQAMYDNCQHVLTYCTDMDEHPITKALDALFQEDE